MVQKLKTYNPELLIEINGGFTNIDQCIKELNHLDGVMIGRSAYKYPLRWSGIDQKIYGEDTKSKKASDIIFSLVPYIENHLKNGGKTWDICKHLINLVEGIPNAKIWRNEISTRSIKQELSIDYLSKKASEIIFSLVPYIEKHLKNEGKTWDICKHLINLVEGIPNAKVWRNDISTKSIRQELSIDYLSKKTSELQKMGF